MLVKRQNGRSPADGEVPVGPCTLDDGRSGTGRDGWDLDLDQELVRLERRREESEKELLRKERSCSARRAKVEARAQSGEDGRQLGCWVGMGDGPADGAA